jgi:hypothetical protein
LVYEIKGRYGEAVEEYLKSKSLSGEKSDAVERLRTAYGTSGWKAFCREKLRQLEDSPTSYISPRDVVFTELELGDKEQTFKWLEEAYKERTEPLLYLRVDPRLDPALRRALPTLMRRKSRVRPVTRVGTFERHL